MSRARVLGLLTELAHTGGRCCPAHSHAHSTTSANTLKEYAFEMACSNIRYGPGVTQEVGMDAKNMNAKNVMLVTDTTVARLPPFQTALDSLTKAKIDFHLFDRVRVEPTDASFQEAIDFARKVKPDLIIAVGGGSVMDTAKAANLFCTAPDAELMDYVVAPIGRGLPVTHTVLPLIAVPTTAGTGSETTGVAVFDLKDMGAKVGLANRALRPTLGLLDPLHVAHMPEEVACYSGFDVFCHALESFTALPYQERLPRPSDPKQRPAYQGSNPISDVWSKHALHIIRNFFKRAVRDPNDTEARSQMHLASCFAGIGFGNAGVHLCHGMSYPISGLVKSYRAKQYEIDHPLIPHGLSVVISAPAVFDFTASACPERHLEAAEILGHDIRRARREDAGKILSEVVRGFMNELNIPDGLDALGYGSEHIPALVEGTLPQHRVTKLSPNPASGEDLAVIFENSMKVY